MQCAKEKYELVKSDKTDPETAQKTKITLDFM